VSQAIYIKHFQKPIFQLAVQRNKINLLVYEPSPEAILQWITHACYADILKKNLQEATRAQPRLQAIELYSVCDVDSGHFLVLATGWDKQRWMDTILFHAHLVDRQVVIEEDHTEENCLDADSAGNVLQVRSVTTQRFVRCIGKVSETVVQELVIGLIICVDYRP
jgi:hypothetical protein